MIASFVCIVAVAAELTAMGSNVSRVALLAEPSVLAAVLPLTLLMAFGFGEPQRRSARDPRAGPPWLSDRFWIAFSALRDCAFRLHGWIAAGAIALWTLSSVERALAPALIATRAENLAPWVAAALALVAGAVVATINEVLLRRLRLSFRSGLTDFSATLMARLHGAAGLLVLLVYALFFQGDADFLTHLAIATSMVPPLSWAATLGFCATLLAWPLRATHRGTFWLFVDTDARAFADDTNPVTGASWSGGPVVVVCSPPDGTHGEHLLACALAGEAGALRIESRADIDAWLRSQPVPEHWTANPRRMMFVEPALLDTVRERCVRAGDSVALLTADSALAQRWCNDEGLKRNHVPVFAGDDEAGFAAYVDELYVRWTETESAPSARPAAATKRSLRPLLSAQLFERFASFALYAHLLQAVMGNTPQPGYHADTVFLIPTLYVVGLLIAGLWLGIGIDTVGGAGDPVATRRERTLHGAVTGLLLGVIGIAALLALGSPLFDAGLVAAVAGIALYRSATTNLLIATYDGLHDAPQRGLDFAALHVISAIGAALGTAVGLKLPLDSPVPIAKTAGFALGASVLCLALAAGRAPPSALTSLLNFLRAKYLLSRRNLMLVACVATLFWLSNDTMPGVLTIFLLLATGGFVLAESDDTRYDKRYETTLLLVLLVVHFSYWFCAANVDNGIGYLVRDLAAQIPAQRSPWTAWQPGILLAALMLLAALRRRVLVNYAAYFLGAGLLLSALASLLTTGLGGLGVAPQWSLSVGIALAATGQLLVAATGFTLLHDLTREGQRAFVISLWLTTPIIAAYVAPAFQSGRPTYGAAVSLLLILIFWLAAVFMLSTGPRSTPSSD